MDGLMNFLSLINEQWPTISACIILIIAIYAKTKKLYMDWQIKTEEEKNMQIQQAKEALKDVILGLVSQAEIDWNYESTEKLGVIKRSTVIEQIYEKYPVLLQVVDKDDLIKEIDRLIDEALITVREKIRTV